MDNYFIILELALFFIFLPIIYNVLLALDLSKIFKKGYTPQIRTLMILLNILFAYLMSRAFTHILELSYNLIN